MTDHMKRSVHIMILLLCCAAAGADNGPSWTPRVSVTVSPVPRTSIDWSQQILYFILIDRFCNGDSSNDAGNQPLSHAAYDPAKNNVEALKTYQGGDLAGVLQKLDYLDSLGVTALWLSPVFDNADEDFVGWWPYHGYFPVDFFNVDEHFGDLDLLREVIKQAHSRGMRIILDMIYNHAAPSHPWVTQPEYWQEQGYRHWFHPHSSVDGSTSISDWQDQQQLENRELNGLPDWAQENPNVYDFMLDYSKFWILATDCDGFRLDAVKHVPRFFWQKLCHDLHKFAGPDFLLLGEVFSGEVDYVASYQNLGFNALFDIPLYYTIQRVFAQGSPITLLSDIAAANAAAYHDVILSSLIDNHDVARFSYYAGEAVEQKIKLALTYLWSLDGLPMLYYGTEAALPGAASQNEKTGEGQDYLNRLPMPWREIHGDRRGLVKYIARLDSVRALTSALQKGRIHELYKDYGIYILLKYNAQDARLVLLNNSTFAERRSIYLDPAVFAPDGIFKDELGSRSFQARGDTLDVELYPLTGSCLRSDSKVNAANLDTTNWRCPMTPRLTRDYRLIEFTFAGEDSLCSVALAGDFNGWSPASHPMTKRDSDELWHIDLPLKPGRYRYKIVLNGTDWIPDPLAKEYELDPYDGRNSVVQVNE
jgi:alpha-amylase